MKNAEEERVDVIWGISKIAAFIGQNDQQTYYMLRTGALPAKQVGSKWVASRKGLKTFLEGAAA